jgi:prepilin-type N-terminal cleavage/methylation domain-containing protein
MAKIVRNSKGFSLVEMMIAIVIIAISFLALSAAIVRSISVNIENELMNSAVRLTTRTAEVLLSLPIDSLHSCGVTADPEAPRYSGAYQYDDSNDCLGAEAGDYLRFTDPVQTIKGIRRKYNVNWDVTVLNSNLRQITISVDYRYRGQNHMNNTVIYKHRIG